MLRCVEMFLCVSNILIVLCVPISVLYDVHLTE